MRNIRILVSSATVIAASLRTSYAFSPAAHTSRRTSTDRPLSLLCAGNPPTDRPFSSMRLHAAEEGIPVEDSSENNASGVTNMENEGRSRTLWGRIKAYFRPADSGMTFKERLAKFGVATALSYGMVSNVSGCLCVSVAWYIFSASNKVSPLAPGQWKGFLAVYSGFFVLLNVIRPLRFALAVSLSPQFDRIINGLQRRFNVSRTSAIAMTVGVFNVCGSFAVLFTGVTLASILSGVSIFPPR